MLPEPRPYPDFADPSAVERQAMAISDALLAHVAAWLDGRGPAAVPRALLPDGVDADVRDVRCVRPEEVAPGDVWIVRPAVERLNLRALRGLYPDPHCTYLVPALFLVPFGCTALVEGEFPHARFLSIQVTPPFDPLAYYYDGAFGAPEVPIVDADIEPLPGHTNPFRPGADRTAARRSYKVTLAMRLGDGSVLEPAYRPPHYRAPGNTRLGGGIVYQGPLARPGTKTGHGRGVWGAGALWVRVYAPDVAAGPLGGVGLPRLSYALPDGRRFLLLADKRRLEARLNRTFPARVIGPREPTSFAERADFGWFRDLGIYPQRHRGPVDRQRPGQPRRACPRPGAGVGDDGPRGGTAGAGVVCQLGEPGAAHHLPVACDDLGRGPCRGADRAHADAPAHPRWQPAHGGRAGAIPVADDLPRTQPVRPGLDRHPPFVADGRGDPAGRGGAVCHRLLPSG